MKKCFICGKKVYEALIFPDCFVCLKCAREEDRDLLDFLSFPYEVEDLYNE
jgi:hypothetical protein